MATTPMVKSFTVGSLDAKGISYDSQKDAATLASRTNNQLETFTGLKTALTASTDNLMLSLSSLTGEFTNARETALSGDIVVVGQDQLASNELINKLFFCKKSTA
ncbi:hypothetical protein [Flavobacterium sp. LB2R40]|uniref:hypothetical protein n=1 Tax=Flavobacterium sp. LB2R40 TaxID=3401722 RepID=UPI003AAE24D3